MDIGVKVFAWFRHWFKLFVNWTLESSFRKDPTHAERLIVRAARSGPIRIIPHNITGRAEVTVLSVQKEIEDLRDVFKPLVIINIEKPFTACRL